MDSHPPPPSDTDDDAALERRLRRLIEAFWQRHGDAPAAAGDAPSSHDASE